MMGMRPAEGVAQAVDSLFMVQKFDGRIRVFGKFPWAVNSTTLSHLSRRDDRFVVK
jgi:hypothetical protein